MSKLRKAMEKAREARRNRGDPSKDMGEALWNAANRETDQAGPVYERINPAYCQTQVMSAEPRLLRKHKIVSLSHEALLSDQLKILRTQILNKMDEKGGNSLLVTSANPQEGKTTTAINLAVSISHKIDRTILLVDADLRKPMIHRFFGCHVERGLSDYLLGRAEIPELLLNPGIEKLVILPGGVPLPNSTEFLGSPRMRDLADEMKGRYPDRFIIFDGPSLLTSADPLVFSRYVDGVLMVVEAERTSGKDLEKALGFLKDSVIMGAVLNKAKG